MTILSSKKRFLFVNFLQRGFVLPVNLRDVKGRWKDFFEIVFLDNFRGLCYYIIYALGKLCPKLPDWWSLFDLHGENASREAALYVCAHAGRTRTRRRFASACTRQTKAINGQKSC